MPLQIRPIPCLSDRQCNKSGASRYPLRQHRCPLVRVQPYQSQTADPDFCIALKRAGWCHVKLGIESGDQGVLDALQKGVSVETPSVALKNLKKAGIATYVYFIFGTPQRRRLLQRRPLNSPLSTAKASTSTSRYSICLSAESVSRGLRRGDSIRETFLSIPTLPIRMGGTGGASGCSLKMNSNDTRLFRRS